MSPIERGETIRSCRTGRKGLRGRLLEWADARLGPNAAWVQRHAALCPTCRRRLAGLNRVDLAIAAMLSQPHRLDLLRRANSSALRMLKRDLREEAQAQSLDRDGAEPALAEADTHLNTLLRIAACLAIILLVRVGVFGTLNKARTHGRAAMKQYYAHHAGQDMADEIWRA